jgi:hypothetical protein
MASSDGGVGEGGGVASAVGGGLGSSVGGVVGSGVAVGVVVVRQDVTSRAAVRITITAANLREFGLLFISASSQFIPSDLS